VRDADTIARQAFDNAFGSGTGVRVWHFTDGLKLRDGTPLRVGKVYRVEPPIIPCERGLHGSVRAIDALKYAPASQTLWVSRCELRGEIVEHGGDKHAASERKVLWAIDATRTLWLFAVWCAESALKQERKAGRDPHPDSWAAPKARRDWLAGKITDAQLRTANSAAYSAAEYRATLARQNRKLEAMLRAAKKRGKR